jgi:hypothetical protein
MTVNERSDEMTFSFESLSSPPSPAPPEVARLSVWRWVIEGWRCAFFLRPSTGNAHPTPFQFAVLVLAYNLMGIGLERLAVDGPAEFYMRSWFLRWWILPFFLWASWATLYLDAKRNSGKAQAELSGLASWFVLSCGAIAPAVLVNHIVDAAQTRGFLDDDWLRIDWASVGASSIQWQHYAPFTPFLLLWLWMLASSFRLALRHIVSRKVFLIYALAGSIFLLYYHGNGHNLPLWVNKGGPGREYARLHLSQALFEKQQTLMKEKTHALLPDRKNTLDVYALVFAPDGSEDVFLRESAMVSDVLRRRFDAPGRLLLLLNHPKTGERLPWATHQNLRSGIDALAMRMDKKNDVLIVYMTSHGTKFGNLHASNWPLEVPPVNAAMLRKILDASGIRNRILIISACYAGTWIPALSNESTLVLTASDSESTSYGCGNLSELTFFGNALFNEQLRKTHSFKAAFAQARIDIRRRELDAGKKDYSNPQISIGPKIEPLLDALEKRLESPPKSRSGDQRIHAASGRK